MAEKINTSDLTFEEVMFTLTTSTQDIFSMYMDVELFAGKVVDGIEPVKSDIVAIVGVGGVRVGYIMIMADDVNALKITQKMHDTEDVDSAAVWDAFGELANNLAGAFKNKYTETYGNVAIGLPLVVSGKISPISESGSSNSPEHGVRVQQKGAIIPFVSMVDGISFHVAVYI